MNEGKFTSPKLLVMVSTRLLAFKNKSCWLDVHDKKNEIFLESAHVRFLS